VITCGGVAVRVAPPPAGEGARRCILRAAPATARNPLATLTLPPSPLPPPASLPCPYL
jgi:hypothetical protein